MVSQATTPLWRGEPTLPMLFWASSTRGRTPREGAPVLLIYFGISRSMDRFIGRAT